MVPMFLIQIVGILLIVGVLLWVLTRLPAVDETIKQFIRIAVIAIVAIWLIWILMGVLGGASPRAWPMR